MRSYFKVDIVLHNGGGIRVDRIIPAGQITTGMIDDIFPFDNEIQIVQIKGKYIKEIMELSVALLPEPSGGFLQVSGMKILVNTGKTSIKLKNGEQNKAIGTEIPGERIQKIEVLGADATYHELDMEKDYTIAVNSFLADGGNGYWMFKKAEKLTPTYTGLAPILKIYLDDLPQMAPVTDGRIQIID